jgi:hypothetical protein
MLPVAAIIVLVGPINKRWLDYGTYKQGMTRHPPPMHAVQRLDIRLLFPLQ